MAWVQRLAWAAVFAALALPVRAAPDEDLLGKADGYPVGTRRTWFYDERVRVGSFSRLDQVLPHYVLQNAATPLPLPAAKPPPPITYRFENQSLTLDDFLAHQRITGLLILKDGQVVAERYQYDRAASHRFVSHSMAKSLVSLAIGLALQEKLIVSLDDTAAKYVPRLAGSAYGETAIRNLLRMASGVQFSEIYDGRDDLAKFAGLRGRLGAIEALGHFNTRDAAQGTRFHYATIETVVLATVIQAVTGGSLSTYLTTRLWQPMGAEAEATWITASDGLEVAGGSFNAVLRDYGRLGVLLANDGAVGNQQVLPRDYLLEATDWHRQPDAFSPRKATPFFGYGYQFWLFPGETRRFALLGVYGQSIFVDPGLKLVMVITAAAHNASVGKESLARERNDLWRGLVGHYGKW